MAGIKIVNLPALGRNLASTDLFELSLAGGTGSRKITGQEIINGIPLPPSGLNIGTTAITSGTVGRVLFEGTGNVVQESANLFWDNTNGALGVFNPTPFSGLTASGIDIGVYNTVGSEANLSVRGFASLGGTSRGAYGAVGSNYYLEKTTGTLKRAFADIVSLIDFGAGGFQFKTSGGGAIGSSITLTELMRINANGNLLINTTTDAGYKLDVNGIARVQGTITSNVNYGLNVQPTSASVFSAIKITNNALSFEIGKDNNTGLAYGGGAWSANFFLPDNANMVFWTNSLQRMRITNTGNLLIGTSTDNGYKFEVNGTGRISSSLNVLGNGTTGNSSSYGFIVQDVSNIVGSSLVHCQGAQLTIFASPQSFAAGGFEPLSSGLSSTNAIAFMNASITRMKIPTTGNVLINTTTDAGFRLDVNGTARVSGELRVGNLQLLTSGSPGATGQGITTTGRKISFQAQGEVNVDFATAYQFLGYADSTIPMTQNAPGRTMAFIQIKGGFISPNYANTQANLLWMNPVYNMSATPNTGQILRGIYYNPTLTDLTNATHFAFHSTSGRVRFENLPTSPAGLNAGDLYNNLGVLMIV